MENEWKNLDQFKENSEESIDPSSSASFYNKKSVTFKGFNEGNIEVSTGTGPYEKRYIIELNPQFMKVKEDLKKISNEDHTILSNNEIQINLININIKDEKIFFSEGSYFVIEPNWLINVSALMDYDFCDRKFFNNRFELKKPNGAMTRGSIVHEIFEDILKGKERDEIIDVWKDSVTKRALNLSILDEPLDEMRRFTLQHVNAITNEKNNHPLLKNNDGVHTEKFIINTDLGLKGKIDAIIKATDENGDFNKAIELKTGKSDRFSGGAKKGHKFQIIAYSLLMKMKNGNRQETPSVMYSGDIVNNEQLITKDVSINYDAYANIINLRNKLVLADYTFSADYEKRSIKKCNVCLEWQPTKICMDIFHLEENRNENNIPVFFSDGNSNRNKWLTEAQKIRYTDEDKKLFNQINKGLVEEYKIIKEEQGKILSKDNQGRIDCGKCIEITEWAIENKKENIYKLNYKNDKKSEIGQMDRCLISDKKGPVKGDCLEATITRIDYEQIYIKTNVSINFKPSFIDLYHSEVSFERNFSMISELLKNKNLTPLKEVFIKDEINVEENEESEFHCEKLNSSQQSALKRALGIKNNLLIQGPPGTGKTYTVAHIVNELNKKNKKIIISCYTHTAIKEIVKKIEEVNPELEIYRIGSSREDMKNFKNHINLESEIANNHSLNTLDKKVEKVNSIINKSPIYIGTTHAWISGNYDNLVGDNEYDISIIDEASQALITNILGVIRLSKTFILVGDHKQLSPVIQTNNAEILNHTLFERLFKIYPENSKNKITLQTQYRMCKTIGTFISKTFYDNKLITDEKCSDNSLDLNEKQIKSEYLDILGIKNSIVLINKKSEKIKHGLNKASSEEARYITKIFKELHEMEYNQEKIGIIAPYRAQVAEIIRNINKVIPKAKDLEKLVKTVDKFQGDEREVIFFSLTLFDQEIPDILQDEKRLNVAFSRAKTKLIVVGDWDAAEGSMILKKLKDYCKNNEKTLYIK